MKYRDRLYADYSAHFGERKAFDPELQFGLYEQVYRDLPRDRDARIADLGCGKGEWLAWLQRRGFGRLTGIDVAASETAFTADGSIEMLTGEITGLLRGKENEFDLLHAKDVLEHLTKDEAVEFLDACRTALKPGGQLWILTFNAQSPMANATRYGDFTHELGVTPVSLAQVLKATGFGEISVRGFLPHSGTLPGQIRALLFGVFEMAASFVLKLRHGSGSPSPGVEANSAMPDLFAAAAKPAPNSPSKKDC